MGSGDGRMKSMTAKETGGFSMNESTPKTSFYYKWLQNSISSSLGKIFPQRSYGYACGPRSRYLTSLSFTRLVHLKVS